jgi:hypothetical protein
MNMETLRCMMINLRECSEGANDPIPPADATPMTLDEAQRAGVTEPCCECGRPVLVGGEGICYQCQCELHSIGAIDMDSDPWNGPVDRPIPEHDYDDDGNIITISRDFVSRTPVLSPTAVDDDFGIPF